MFTGIVCSKCRHPLVFATRDDGSFEEPARLVHGGVVRSRCARHDVDPAALREMSARIAIQAALVREQETRRDAVAARILEQEAKITALEDCKDARSVRRRAGHSSRLAVLSRELRIAELRLRATITQSSSS